MLGHFRLRRIARISLALVVMASLIWNTRPAGSCRCADGKVMLFCMALMQGGDSAPGNDLAAGASGCRFCQTSGRHPPCCRQTGLSLGDLNQGKRAGCTPITRLLGTPGESLDLDDPTHATSPSTLSLDDEIAPARSLTSRSWFEFDRPPTPLDRVLAFRRLLI